ncbi:MAG TPA: hypothetical protein VJK50_00330, partial [Patescibacteria group bacterium]|nr:hypothetical protein [Patescibacteria group bacterium]
GIPLKKWVRFSRLSCEIFIDGGIVTRLEIPFQNYFVLTERPLQYVAAFSILTFYVLNAINIGYRKSYFYPELSAAQAAAI